MNTFYVYTPCFDGQLVTSIATHYGELHPFAFFSCFVELPQQLRFVIYFLPFFLLGAISGSTHSGFVTVHVSPGAFFSRISMGVLCITRSWKGAGETAEVSLVRQRW